jgi:hypothetical protein
MGLAFGLSRDEELEKTRLDLERARMEREDFRQGGGPDTKFMQTDVKDFSPEVYERLYKYKMRPDPRFQESAGKREKKTSEICDHLQHDLELAFAALKHIARHGGTDDVIRACEDVGLSPEDIVY